MDKLNDMSERETVEQHLRNSFLLPSDKLMAKSPRGGSSNDKKSLG